jgi:hypothetical protein
MAMKCGKGIDVEDIEIAARVGSTPRQVRQSLESLAGVGVVKWRAVGGRAKACINSEYFAFTSFARFLAETGIRIK